MTKNERTYGPDAHTYCLFYSIRFQKGVAVSPMFYGGGWEAGLMPGTENTPMIAGLGAACGLVTRNLNLQPPHADCAGLHSFLHLWQRFRTQMKKW